MPLISGNVGGYYYTSDATALGDWCHVEWLDWWRMKKVKSREQALDTSEVVYTTGQGARGAITHRIPSCPAALYAGLRILQTSTSHYTLTVNHPQLGVKAYDVEVLSLIAEGDDQFIAGDPIENVTVRYVSFGLA